MADGKVITYMPRKATGEEDRPAQRDRLVKVAAASELWHSHDREPYSSVQVGQHFENWPIRSRDFRRWLAGRYFDDCCGAPTGQAMEDALRVVEMLALRGPQCETFLRIGHQGDKVYLDLGDESWRGIEITASDWKLVGNPPVKFRRNRAMRPLPEPERGESIDVLRPFLNTATEADFTLAIACLVAWFSPLGPYPILMISGEQGSAKSTMARFLRNLVDPRAAGLRALPRDERDLFVAAFNSWCLAFDNVSAIPNWLSDAFCRLSTGGGFGTRELHTDREETIFDEVRAIILNGIPDLAGRPDLGDRAVATTLSAIPEVERRPERELQAEFDKARPAALGALLDAVAGALRNHDEVRIERWPRMADFARWVTAAESSLGWVRGAFMAAYTANRASAIELAVEDDPVGSAVRALAEEIGHWKGSATELLHELDERADEKVKNRRAWPRMPNGLSTRLRRIAPGLRRVGVEVEMFRAATRDRRRLIEIRYRNGC